MFDSVGRSSQYDILSAVEQKLYDGGVFAVFPTFEMPTRTRVQQHIIFAVPTLLTQFLPHAFPCILCHPKAYLRIGHVFWLDKRRKDIQLVFNDMMAGIQLMVDKIMTETPPKTVALDAVQTHAATGAQFGDYCRAPLVGQVESPVVIACLQLRQKVFLTRQLLEYAQLLPISINGKNLRNLRIIGNQLLRTGVYQHIDFAIGETSFQRIDHRRAQKHISMMAQFDDQNTFGLG